jgi:hypothetical protein
MSLTNAYANAMPMGGALPAKPTRSTAPRLVNHDSYQEKVFDVALSGNRRVD